MKTFPLSFALRRLAIALLALAPLARAVDLQDSVMRAMRDELNRSMTQLQLENRE